MERKRKNATTLRRSLAFIMTLIMAFYMSFACEMNALATDYGDKNLQGSDQTVTITFDPHGGVFKDDGTTETRETNFFTAIDDNNNHYHKVNKDADIPELEERLGYAFEGWYFNGQKLEDGDSIFADVAFDAQWSVMDSNTDAETGTDVGTETDTDTDTGIDADTDTGIDADTDTEIPSEDTNSEEENLEDTEATQPGEEITVAFDPQGGVFKDDGTGETRETIFFADRTDNDNQYYDIFIAADIPLLEERPGYVFEGWYNEETKLEEGSRIFAGMTFEAQWSEIVATNLLAAVSSGAKEFGEKEFTVPGESVTLFFDPKGGTFENNGTTETRELAFPAQELNEENYYYSIISAEDILELEERPGYTFEGWYFEGEKLEAGDHIYGELVQFNAKWKGSNTATVNENVEGLFGGTLPVIEFGGAGQAAQLAVQALAEPKSAEALAADAAALSIADLDVDSAVQLDIDLVSGTVGSYGVVITMPIPTALADADQIAAIHYGQTTEAIRCEVSEDTDTLSFTLESFSPVVLLAGKAPEYATVYIENVKGGALAVFNSKDVKLLPVGENVQIAIGDTLYMLAYPMEDGKGTIESVGTKAETTGGRPIPLVGPFDGTYTLAVTQDTIFTTTFERVAENLEDSLSVKPAQEDFLVAAGESGTSISTTLRAYREGKALTGATFTKSEKESGFEFTLTEGGGLTSDGEVELGCYTVYVDVTYGGETYEELPVVINSGSSVTIEQYVANNVRSDLLNMCFDKSLAYAQGTGMETVLNNGFAAFPMYNYDTFAGVYTADGRKVSGSDAAVPLAKNHYFLRHANNEGELYSLTVPSLPAGSSDDGDNGDNDSDNGSSGGSGSSSADKYVPDSSIVEKADGVKVTLTGSSSKISSAQLKKFIAKNEDKPIIFNGPDYTITFAKGSMQTSAGQTSVDFSLKIGVDADSLNLPEADVGNLALVLSFKHSGALPGEAAITVKAGSRYAGQTLHYYYYNESTDQMEFRQSVSVDAQGFVTVKQNHCSDYVLLTQKLTVKEVGLERTYGESRYDTAVEIAKAYFSDGADTVILARGDVSADALPAVPLAKKLNAPILLTPPDNLPDNVLAQIQALGTKKVIITGGTGAVKTAVSEQLEAQGISVERIYGTTQYETAYEIAKSLNSASGRAVLVNGNSGQGSFADALSIAPWAGYQGVPILYAGGEGEMLPEATARAFSELGINQTLLIGGTAVLPQSLESLVPNAQRYDGIDRYATNARVLANLQPNPQAIYVVSGRDFADALSAAAVAAQNNAWLLLAGYEGEGGSNGLTKEQEVLLHSVKESVAEIRIFGGTMAVPKSTLEAVEALLRQ